VARQPYYPNVIEVIVTHYNDIKFGFFTFYYIMKLIVWLIKYMNWYRIIPINH